MKNYLLNPVKGAIRDISSSSDELFAQKSIGDGIIVIPNDSVIVAPTNGEVKSIFPTKHAISFESENGIEILIHIGIDTVELEGNGFNQLVNNGDVVKAGTPLMKVDFDSIEKSGYSTECLMIIVSKKKFKKEHIGEKVFDYVPVLEFNR